MRTVHKYPILPNATRGIEAMTGPVLLAGHDNRGEACVWIEGDPEMPMRRRIFGVFGTGYQIPDGAGHCGSWIEAPYVWHVYEMRWSTPGE